MDDNARNILTYEAVKKSTLIAYLLWFFLGSLGAHRFYLGKNGSAITMLLLSLISSVLSVIGIGYLGFIVIWVWLLADLFLTYAMVRDYNLNLLNSLR